MRRVLSPLLLVAFLAAAGPAWARAPESWATVNRCDQAANAIGVRAGAAARPGERIFARFEAQWYRIAAKRFVSTGASSRWLRVGGGRTALAQAGFSFSFGEPPSGMQFVLRGEVDFQWRVPRRGRWLEGHAPRLQGHAGGQARRGRGDTGRQVGCALRAVVDVSSPQGCPHGRPVVLPR